MAEFKVEILQSFGVLSENNRGWQKELCLVSWNERDPKYDIRDWSPLYEKCGKGVTLTLEELIELKTILNQMDL